MKKIAAIGIALATGAVVTGCVGNRLSRAKYVADGEVISGSAEQATVYDMDSGIQSLMERMRNHPTFMRSYEEMKSKINRMPSLKILAFECDFPSEDFASRVNMIQTKVSVSVFESELFTIRDSSLADAIGLSTPDCLLRGTVSRVREKGGCHVYRLHVRLTDVNAATIMWEGTETIQKVN